MKVYLSENIDAAALELLKSRAEIVSDFSHPEQLDAIIIRGARVTREVMEKAHKLKVIAKHGVGCDSIDVKAAKELGIQVVYTPVANVQSVAELIVALMTNIARNVCRAFDDVRASKVKKIAPADLIGVELHGKTVGLVGVGHISQLVAGILKNGYGMKAIGFDSYVDRVRFDKMGIEKFDDLKTMLSRADFVSISVPLTDSTRNMIGEAELRSFKPTAILVNASRGHIVDEKALHQALTQGWLRAAAFDVFADEPPGGSNPLMSLPNFIATPHIGACTEEAMQRTGKTIVEEVFRVLDGKEPLYPVR